MALGKQMPPRYYLAPIPVKVSGATDIAPAKPGFTPVLLGYSLAAPGKIQSNAATDMSDTLPAGSMIASPQVPYLLVGEDGLKMNITAGTGFCLVAYFKTPTQNPSGF